MGIFDRFKRPLQNEQDFAWQAMTLARKRADIGYATIGDDFSIEYEHDEGGEGTLYLGNVWAQVKDGTYREQMEALEHLISLAGAKNAPESWDQIKTRVYPALRGASYLTFAEVQGTKMVRRPALPSLCQMLCVDHESTVATLNESQLADFGVTVEEAWRQADANLRENAPAVEATPSGTMSRIVTSTYDAASLMMADGWLSRFAQPGCRVMAWTSGRDSLTVLTFEGELPIEGVAKMAFEEWEGEARKVSPCLYTTDEAGRVVPVEGHTDEQRSMIERAYTALVATEYHEQKIQLDEHHLSQGVDIHVAQYMVYEREGALIRVAVWPPECHGWLPEADFVVLVDEGQDPVEVPFEQAKEDAGLTPIPGLTPVRYEVTDWPENYPPEDASPAGG